MDTKMVAMLLIVLILIYIVIWYVNSRKLMTTSQKKLKKKEKNNSGTGDYDELMKKEDSLENVDYTHGTARFLGTKEIQQMISDGHLGEWKIGDSIEKNKSGIVMGIAPSGNIMYNKDPEHAIIIAATGGGKTQSFVKPTLALLGSSGENVFMSDPKGEGYRETSTFFRKQGYDVFLLNLKDKDKSDRWNPFWESFEKYTSSEEILKEKGLEEIEILSNTLKKIGEGKGNSSSPIWQESEKVIYQLCILLMFEFTKRKLQILEYYKANPEIANESYKFIHGINVIDETKNYIEPMLKKLIENEFDEQVYDKLVHEVKMDVNFKTMFQYMKVLFNKSEDSLEGFSYILAKDKEIRNAYNIINIKTQMIENQAEETYQSMFATPRAKLIKFTLDIVNDVLSGYPGMKGYIDIEKIAISEKQIIYNIFSEGDDTYNYIAQFLIQNLYNKLSYIADNNESKELNTRFHFLLEEFGNYPKIDGFHKWLTIARGRGLRFYIVLQAFSQLEEIYGKEECSTIRANVLYIQMPLNDLDTARYFSEFFGSATIDDVSVDESLKKGSGIAMDNNFDYSVKTNKIKRNLKNPDEIMITRIGEAYIKKPQYRPFRVDMPLVYKYEKLSTLLKGNEEKEGREILRYDKDIVFKPYVKVDKSIILDIRLDWKYYE